jgi:hypothetical protein
LVLVLLLINPLTFRLGIIAGANDLAVASLLLWAIWTRHSGKYLLCGAFLGLAALLKFYPLVFLPFIAVDQGRFNIRVIGVAIIVVLAGMGVAATAWGASILSPLLFAMDRNTAWLSAPSALAELRSIVGDWPAAITERYNTVLVGLTAITCLVVAQRWKIRWEWAVSVFPLTIMVVYRLGHPQFHLSILAVMVASSFLSKDRYVMWAFVPYACVISIFGLAFPLGSVSPVWPMIERWSGLAVVTSALFALVFVLYAAKNRTHSNPPGAAGQS